MLDGNAVRLIYLDAASGDGIRNFRFEQQRDLLRLATASDSATTV